MRQPLEAGRKLGGHHLLAVEPTPVDDKGTVTDRVNHAPLLSPEINVGCDSLEHDDIVPGNNVDDLALMLAKHYLIKGALTTLAGTAVSLNLASLSVSAPEHVPIPTTWSSRSTVGMAITHSFVFRKAAKE